MAGNDDLSMGVLHILKVVQVFGAIRSQTWVALAVELKTVPQVRHLRSKYQAKRVSMGFSVRQAMQKRLVGHHTEAAAVLTRTTVMTRNREPPGTLADTDQLGSEVTAPSANKSAAKLVGKNQPQLMAAFLYCSEWLCRVKRSRASISGKTAFRPLLVKPVVRFSRIRLSTTITLRPRKVSDSSRQALQARLRLIVRERHSMPGLDLVPSKPLS